MKVVLSRKGFDSRNGGLPSLIMPNGDVVSMPIPSDDRVKYSELQYGDKTYWQILKELRPSFAPRRYHLDPDLDAVYLRECNLTLDFYLGEDFVYNNSKPFGKIVREIQRGAKLPVEAWKAVEGDDSSPVKKVAFKHFSEGLIDERLPGLTAVPPGAEDAVLEPGDLLISRMDFPFKVAVVEYRNEKLVADENVWIVRMDGNRALAYYLRAYLESERGAKWLSRLSAGATLRTISAKNIEKIPVPDADEAEIGKIADELRVATFSVCEARKRWDEAREKMAVCYVRIRKD